MKSTASILAVAALALGTATPSFAKYICNPPQHAVSSQQLVVDTKSAELDAINQQMSTLTTQIQNASAEQKPALKNQLDQLSSSAQVKNNEFMVAVLELNYLASKYNCAGSP